MDVLKAILGLVLWAPCGWHLFKVWFGSPQQFRERYRNTKGSESSRYIRDGFLPALFAQAFEIAVAAFVVFNLLMWLVCVSLVDMLFTLF